MLYWFGCNYDRELDIYYGTIANECHFITVQIRPQSIDYGAL